MSTSQFVGLLTTFEGYVIIATFLVRFHYVFSALQLYKIKRVFGFCYVVKVGHKYRVTDRKRNLILLCSFLCYFLTVIFPSFFALAFVLTPSTSPSLFLDRGGLGRAAKQMGGGLLCLGASSPLYTQKPAAILV